MMEDVRGKRGHFFKMYARGMQGGLINIWRFSRVCNVFTLSKVKSQRGRGQKNAASYGMKRH